MPTAVDVARRAGVSVGTVSHVVSGNRPVRKETRARVLAAMDELGWQPNVLARSLIEGRTRSVGLVTLALKRPNPYFMEMALEFERAARLRDYQLFLMGDPGNIGTLLGRQVDGLFVVAGSVSDDQLLPFRERRIPIVSVGSDQPHSASWPPMASSDFFCAGVMAAGHIVELGHHRIAVIAEQAHHATRVGGFRAQLEQSGLCLPAHWLVDGQGTPEGGYAAATALLDHADRPTAIFATNDLMALGVLEAATDLGLRVPGDLSVVGHDNILLSAHIRPALTTVAIPHCTLAEEATDLLLQLIERGKLEAAHRIWRPNLVIRQSTGPPPDNLSRR